MGTKRTPHIGPGVIHYLVAFTCDVHLVKNGYRPSIGAGRVAQYDRVSNQTKGSVHFLHLKFNVQE